MKPHKTNPSSPKLSAAIVTPIAVLLVLALVSVYDMTFSNRYPHINRVAASSSSPSPSLPSRANSSSSSAPPATTAESCDLTRGQWNCMKFGKPSLEFMRWRWRPDGCDLPRFDAARFLEAMRGKYMAFIGDSLARNHLKSLLCLLSKVAQPVEVRMSPEIDVTGRAVRRDYHYGDHGFTISLFWSPFLVKANQSNATLGQWDLHLDTGDDRWAAHIADFDYIVLSGTNWFLRPSLPVPRAVRAAFRTALGAIAAREGFRGKAVLRTVTPAHFENGEWNTGGDCVRTSPFRRGSRALGAVEAEYRGAQVDALRETEAAARRNGAELLLLDITEAMDLRPDGHPSRYGHSPGGSVEGSFVVDCLHWCLPGPIDLWSELLLQLLIAHPS
ncbi:protein trichome birefringence-like 21 [Panicum miliaceum]|uniref:Protein trichome birefringence-like 21 n=1 Tax=Panicum miliaceum TaxID=4540 RepID=A0A3L6RMK6_PANMI|nr:protein trichome birefringence-like 21 [Panicum miliaceum]